MKHELQNRISLLAENTQAIKVEFNWSMAMTSSIVARLAALLCTIEGKRADCKAIRESYNIIKSSASIFSVFRGNMVLCIAALLSFKKDREELFTKTVTVYEMMKSVGFRPSDYLTVAAYQIAANADAAEYEQVVTRARAFYDSMKAQGFFRVGEDDYIFAAMLALSKITVNEGATRIERLYRHLRSDFRSGNSVQALAQILVFGGESGECDTFAARLYAINDELKSKKLRLDGMFTLSSLGVLALLPAESRELARDIEEAHTFLKTQRGYGAFSVTKQERLLLSAAVVAAVYAQGMENGVLTASVSTSLAGIIIAAQQAAAIANMTALVAASQSSSS